MTITSNTHDHDRDYQRMLTAVRESFKQQTDGNPVLYFTKSDKLFDQFLASLPAEERQVHTCDTCRSFFKRYAGLVTMVNGRPQSVMFGRSGDVPFYANALDNLRREVESRPINGVFYTGELRWGTATTGPWSHMAITPDKKYVYKETVRTAGQERAERRHEFETLRRAISEFKEKDLETARFLLEQNTLYRSHQILGRVEWLAALKAKYELASRGQKDLLLWEAVATAPAGFAKPRAGVVGQLLEDIASGMAFDQVKARFDASMAADKYQRPQAAPKEGNIAQAEKVIQRLGSAGSLRRRFARIEDLQLIWAPGTAKAANADTGGVFDHLKKGLPEKQPMDGIKGPDMSFTQFREDVLAKASSLYLYVGREFMTFGAYITAADMDAPTIIQWDRDEQRNPVTWYVYKNGSPADRWALAANAWTKITGISLHPNMWYPDPANAHHGEGALLVLEGAVDKANKASALFPEFLHSDYHSIRRTLEHHSKVSPLEGHAEASACGLNLEKGSPFGNVKIRAVIDGRSIDYTLSRW
jgi:hypothetical protein